jgi:hypothetical protein
VVLIHRFDVLGVDLHCHKISSPNSSYFSRNRRFSLLIFRPNRRTARAEFSRKSTNWLKPVLRPAKAGSPAKAGPTPAKAGPCPASYSHQGLVSMLVPSHGLVPHAPRPPYSRAPTAQAPVAAPAPADRPSTGRHHPRMHPTPTAANAPSLLCDAHPPCWPTSRAKPGSHLSSPAQAPALAQPARPARPSTAKPPAVARSSLASCLDPPPPSTPHTELSPAAHRTTCASRLDSSTHPLAPLDWRLRTSPVNFSAAF